MDELYTAERGGGAFMNDRRLRVAGRIKLVDTVIGCGMPHLRPRPPRQFPRRAAQRHGRGLGRAPLGSAALDLAYVAAGRMDGFWETGLSAWDIAAGLLLIREAGGFVSDMDGGQDMLDNGSVVAGNEVIQRALLKTVKNAALHRADRRGALIAPQSQNRNQSLKYCPAVAQI